jgi:hypothetical protein
MPRGVIAASLAAVAAAAFATPAAAATLTVSKSVKRTCTTLAPAGTPGTARSAFSAQTEGLLTTHLSAASGDWDLAFFQGGRLVAGSNGFGAREVADAIVDRGTVTVQACRRKGTARRATLGFDFLPLQRLDQAPGKLSLVRVPFVTRSVVPRLEAAGLDVTHDAHSGQVTVLLHQESDKQILGRLNLPFVVIVDDVLAKERAERAKDEAYTRRMGAKGSPLPSTRTDYRTLEDFGSELKALVEKHPKIARPYKINQKTFEGRELGAIEIADDVANANDGRPTFVLNALHHAREWPAAEGAMEFATDLVNGYGSDARITDLLKKVRVVVMPLTNSDGYNVSRNAPNPDPDEEQGIGTVYSTGTGVVLFGGSLGYKRKNCNPGTGQPTGAPCEFAIGVDPNRNYGNGWGGPGASTNPNDQSYRGTGPFSEPEPRAVKELFSGLNATSMLTIHTVAGLVLRPPGLEANGFAPDEEALKALGEKMATATGYQNQYGWELYDTTGTTDDWSYAATGGFGYTIEMGPAGGSFHGNYETYVVKQYLGDGDTAVGGLREAYLLAAEAARDASQTSRIAGRAPAGRTLRITKAFQTDSYPVCPVADPIPVNGGPDTCPTAGTEGEIIKTDEKLDFSMKVPASGRYEWWVNPSTRPFPKREGKTETYTLTCEDGGKVIETKSVVVDRGQAVSLDLPCGGTLVNGASAPTLAPITLKVVSVRRFKGSRALKVKVRASGAAIKNVKVAFLRGKKRLGTGRIATLSGTKTLRVKIVKGTKVRKGKYVLRFSAKGFKITNKRISVTR